MAAGEDGQVLAVYSRFVPGAPYESLRVRARLLTSEVAPMPHTGRRSAWDHAGGRSPGPLRQTKARTWRRS